MSARLAKPVARSGSGLCRSRGPPLASDGRRRHGAVGSSRVLMEYVEVSGQQLCWKLYMGDLGECDERFEAEVGDEMEGKERWMGRSDPNPPGIVRLPKVLETIELERRGSGTCTAFGGSWIDCIRNQVGSGRCERAHRQARGVEERQRLGEAIANLRWIAGIRRREGLTTRHPLLASSLGNMPATFGRTLRMQEGRQAGVSSISCLSCLTLGVAAGCRAAPCTGKRGQPPVLATFQPPVSGTSSGDTVRGNRRRSLSARTHPKSA
ncbi:hypothetical protein L1887_57372 [Cichorium endivia]|nr:hypothetical protein L1887_57372 [Cichorium endivia]